MRWLKTCLDTTATPSTCYILKSKDVKEKRYKKFVKKNKKPGKLNIRTEEDKLFFRQESGSNNFQTDTK